MKKIVTLSAMALFGLAIFTGCSKKSDSPSYSMKATVGGTAFNAAHTAGTLSGTALMISGWTGTSTTATPPDIIISIPNYTGPSTYNFDSTGLTIMGEYVESSTSIKLAKSGSVTVSSASSNSYTGTFNFVTTDGTSVSGGTFTVQKF